MKVIKVSCALASAVVVTRLVWATCYVNPSYQCRTNTPLTYPDCVSKTYSMTTGSYCDSRDGECGRTGCTPQSIPVTRIDQIWDPYQGTCVPPVRTVGPIPSGTCSVAVLSGNQCGYCPGD